MSNRVTSESAEAVAWTARTITDAIDKSTLTKLSISDQTGIPYSTLNRKLAGKSDFTFAELILLADAIGVSPADFTPPALQRSCEKVPA